MYGMRYVYTLILFFLVCNYAHAYTPEVVTQATLHDITEIQNPESEHVFFGELNNIPNTYEIKASEPFLLHIEIRVPDIETSKNIISGIVIKDQKKGRVEEVTRLLAKDASWVSRYDMRIGESYREGPVFEKQLDPGIYRIEMHTPDNLEKYIFVIGNKNIDSPGYFELLGRIADVKRFYGKSAFWSITSSYVYIPLVIVGLMGGVLWFWYRRKRVN